MPSMMDPRRLRPHPANMVLPELDSETYEALKADIAAHGIQVAVMITPAFTIIAGHHRVRAAVELGLGSVPVAVHDVGDTEAERLLIADNLLRRQITDPMAKARLIARLKELHGVHQGINQYLGGASATMAEAVIRREKWRFSYGRKATPERIANFPMPVSEDILRRVQVILAHAQATESLMVLQAEDVFDTEVVRARLHEIEEDPSELIEGEELRRRFAQLGLD